MARRTSIVAMQEIRDINLTPLIDLSFLLLITFIITIPMMEQGIPLNLPKGKAEDVQNKKARTISLNAKGEVFLDNRQTTIPELTSEMSALGAADPDTLVYVRADESIAYGKVAEVVRILHQSKLNRMALMTRTD